MILHYTASGALPQRTRGLLVQQIVRLFHIRSASYDSAFKKYYTTGKRSKGRIRSSEIGSESLLFSPRAQSGDEGF